MNAKKNGTPISNRPEKAETIKASLYLGLVHYPIKSKDGRIVQTSVTNLDIHDIARTAKTYDLNGYFLIAPPLMQTELIDKIIGHWSHGYGSEYNPDRNEALSLVEKAESIEDACKRIETRNGLKTVVIITDAKIHQDSRNITCNSLQNMLKLYDFNFLLLFGTGWGLADAVIAKADYILEPVRPPGRHLYNHLSVRAAAAIIIDRIIGENPKEILKNK